MEFKSIKIAGHNIMAIFCGTKYVFYDDWAGVVAVAYRDQACRYDEMQRFVLHVGNEHYLGSSLTNSTIIKACKAYINKSEKRNIDREVEFEIEETKLQHKTLVLQVV